MYLQFACYIESSGFKANTIVHCVIHMHVPFPLTMYSGSAKIGLNAHAVDSCWLLLSIMQRQMLVGTVSLGSLSTS